MDKIRTDPYKKKVGLISALSIAAFITCAASRIVGDGQREEMQRALSDRMLRMHIVAASDSDEDQMLKLKVKKSVLEYFADELPKGLDAAGTKAWARGHTKELASLSYEALKKEGADFPVKAVVEPCYFCEMLCGGILFPEGVYDTLRIEIGRAQGKNWWCVLYPWLCPGKTGRIVVPGEKGKAESAAAQADILSFKKFKIKWYYKYAGKNDRKSGREIKEEKFDGVYFRTETDADCCKNSGFWSLLRKREGEGASPEKAGPARDKGR